MPFQWPTQAQTLPASERFSAAKSALVDAIVDAVLVISSSAIQDVGRKRTGK